jgi:hypothetical protein
VGAVRRHPGASTVYASWNGATQVTGWRVLAGAGQLRAVASAPRRGFETAITVPGRPASFEVQALGAGGRVLGTSKAVS